MTIPLAMERVAPGLSLPPRRMHCAIMPVRSADDGLATAFAAHERSAFEQAYRRYSSLLYSAAYNVLGNADDAQDCVHDALARVWRSRNAYSASRGSLSSFLTVCVRNEAISRRRSQQRRMRMEQRLAAEPETYDEISTDDPIERDQLRAAMSTLPEEQRAPLELAYYGGRTHREVATELQQPLGTVKSRISQGLRKLAAALRSSTLPGTGS